MSAKKAGHSGPLDPRWVRTIVSLVLFAGVTTASIISSTALFNEAKAERVAEENSAEIVVDSIYSDRIEGKYDPDYDRSRYQDIARSFEQDPVFIDEYEAFEIDDGDIVELRNELAGDDVPIYVAVLALSKDDSADGDADITAARIARELSVERATVLVIGGVSQGLGHRGVVRTWDERPEVELQEKCSRTALNHVRALEESEIDDEGAIYASTIDDNGEPIVVAEDTRKDPRDLKYSAGSAVAGAIFGAIVGIGSAGVGLFVLSLLRDRTRRKARR